MNEADKDFKAWYEKESGQEISEGEFYEMKHNLLEFYHILDRWYREG